MKKGVETIVVEKAKKTDTLVTVRSILVSIVGVEDKDDQIRKVDINIPLRVISEVLSVVTTSREVFDVSVGEYGGKLIVPSFYINNVVREKRDCEEVKLMIEGKEARVIEMTIDKRQRGKVRQYVLHPRVWINGRKKKLRESATIQSLQCLCYDPYLRTQERVEIKWDDVLQQEEDFVVMTKEKKIIVKIKHPHSETTKYLEYEVDFPTMGFYRNRVKVVTLGNVCPVNEDAKLFSLEISSIIYQVKGRRPRVLPYKVKGFVFPGVRE